MIEEKINQADLALYEILRNPVLCAEFIHNVDKYERDISAPIKLTWYQKDMACDFNDHVCFCCARSVGKTFELSDTILWLMINNLFPEDYIVYTVPAKNHLEPVFSRLTLLLRTNSFLKNFIEQKSGINAGEYIIQLLNKSKLLCRIAGQSGTETNVSGLHTPFIMTDEAGFYPWGTYKGLMPDINSWTPGHRMMVSGVPTGLREKNVLWTSDQENKEYTHHRATAFDNPKLTPEDLEKFKADYGGEDSEDYIHYVLGKHGKPVFSIFDRNGMQLESYPVHKMVLNGTEGTDDLSSFYGKLSIIPSIPIKNTSVLMGIDLGYTEPTAIFILYRDEFGRLKFHTKITFIKITYPIQLKLIDYLVNKFNPGIIGIDEGNTGKSVIQHLYEDPSFQNKMYKQIIYPVDFSSNVILGMDSDGKEIKGKTKPYSVKTLQEYCTNHFIVFSYTDLETVAELERMTYTKDTAGNPIYRTLTPKGGKKGEDHFTSALLCAALAYYMKNENLIGIKSKKLFKPSWI